MSSRLIFWFAANLLPLPVAHGQIEVPQSFSSSTWTNLNGLPQNSVGGICQDADGYLWVGTNGGLARFDGSRFVVYDVGNRSDLEGNRFIDLVLGSGNSLWMNVQDVGLVHYQGDQFTHVATDDVPRKITLGSNGLLWVAFDDGLGRLIGNSVEIVRQGPVGAMLSDRDGSLWIAPSAPGLIRLRAGIETTVGQDDGLPDAPLISLLQDSTGVIWAGARNGLWHGTSPENDSFERFQDYSAAVDFIEQDLTGAIWVNGDRLLSRLDPESGTVVTVDEGQRFSTIFTDARGSLWVGTRGSGLKCFRQGPLHNVGESIGLDPVDTYSITAGRSGSVLLVQTRTLFEARGTLVSRLPFDENVRSALVDQTGDLWVGQPNGLLRFKGSEVTAYGENDGISGRVHALLEGRDGTLLVGTTPGFFKQEGERFTRVHGEELTGIRCILEEETTGVLWLGAHEGLARLEGDSISWLTTEDGLSRGSVRSLHMAPEGTLWVGTYGGGLNRVEGGRITQFTKENGLADNFLGCILEDDDERLWINSNIGPFVVQRAALDRVARGEADTVDCVTFAYDENVREGNGGSQPSGWRAPNGDLWFPTIQGALLAIPSQLSPNEPPPRVRIESLVLGENRTLDVDFAGLGITSPERLRLQYRLIGHEPKWIEAKGNRSVHYSYLPAGNYEFRLRGRNGFGDWSPEESWSLDVESRFHETWVFVALIALVVGLAVFGVTERRIKLSRERTAELTRLISHRERAEQALNRTQVELSRLSRELLTQRDAERRHLSQELHDDVTQRLAALAMKAELAEVRLGSATGKSHERLREIAEMAQELAGDVQQLSRRLHPIGLRTLGLTEAIRQECDAFMRRDGIRIDLSLDTACDGVSDDIAVAAFRILQESLHNIEKHACAETVEVTVRMKPEGLVLSVADRGRGFEIETGTEGGLGLITMRERAASVGGELSIVSKKQEGTTVRLCVSQPRT